MKTSKYYKKLKNDIFPDLDLKEYIEVYSKFTKLKTQYKMLRIAQFLEKKIIYKIDIPILGFIMKLLDFSRWKIYDFIMLLINGRQFNLFGVTIFCGRQGSGKTIGIVEQLERIKQEYPQTIICTNIHYLKQDIELTDWRQLLELRNGTNGVVFVIDEIQNEYDNSKWKDFPERIVVCYYTTAKTTYKNISI